MLIYIYFFHVYISLDKSTYKGNEVHSSLSYDMTDFSALEF